MDDDKALLEAEPAPALDVERLAQAMDTTYIIEGRAIRIVTMAPDGTVLESLPPSWIANTVAAEYAALSGDTRPAGDDRLRDDPSEYGRLLAERDRLVEAGIDPSELAVPLPPLTWHDGMTLVTHPDGTLCWHREPQWAEARSTPSLDVERGMDPKYVAFAQRAGSEMVRRLDHGRAKFGVDWDEEPYRDEDNEARIRRAVDHLIAARAASPDPAEWAKRAADVANQAFMYADPDRVRPAGDA